MRAVLAFVAVLGCASGPRSTASLDAPTAQIPRWAEPVGALAAATGTRVLPAAPTAQTVRIVEAPAVDPLDAVLGARGRRRVRDLSLRDAPVGDTLRLFATMGGFNVVCGDELAGRRVTVQLRDVSLRAAFRTVLAAAGAGATVVGGEVVHVTANRGG
ncbi:MAG: hypothetical protein U0325_09365 [Polyangiales bacterium]